MQQRTSGRGPVRLPLVRCTTWFVATALGLAACGGDDDGGGAEPSGEVTAPWDDYCVATFTADLTVKDGFGDVALRLAAGERYLLGEFEDFAGAPRATILLLTSRGPVDFELGLSAGQPQPFTTSCTKGETTQYVGVFRDVAVYKDKELSQKACDLPAGAVMVATGYGFSLASAISFDPAQPSIYSISTDPALGGLDPSCGSQAEGFVQAFDVKILDTYYTAMPLQHFLGPR